MSGRDRYERGQPRRYAHEEFYEERDRDGRYMDRTEGYLSVYPPSRDLVPRNHREDSDLSVEEIRRDFPPPGHRDIRRARSAEPYHDEYYDRNRDYRRGHHDDSRHRKHSTRIEIEEDAKERMMSKQEKIFAALAGAALAMGGKEVYDRYDAKSKEEEDIQRNYLASAALGAAGAFAGYQGAELYAKQKSAHDRKKLAVAMRRDSYGSSEDEKSKEGEKNFLEKALAGTGLAATVAGLAGKAVGGGGGGGKKDAKSETQAKIQNAAKAAILAGATEAFRVSKEPGSWKGEKLKRVATAAMGASAISGAATSGDKKSSKATIAESVIGGLVGNRVINGSKKDIEEDELTGRSRSRSRRSRSRAHSTDGGGSGGGVPGLAALATAGLGILGAKKAYDSHQERSQSRRRGSDSDDSRSPDRHRRSRSRSVVDSARKSLAKFGIGSQDDRDDRRRDQDDFDSPPRRQATRRRRYSDEYDDDRYGDYDDRPRREPQRDRSRNRRPRSVGTESDLGDSSEDEKRAKKMKGKQIITTALATVATIHAAHEVYESVEKRNARAKAVKEGKLSPDEAKKLKTKAMLQDAASVGIAALGIKGAVSNLKEAKEQSEELKRFKEEKRLRHEKRLERQQRFNGGQHRSRDDGRSSSSAPRLDRYPSPAYSDDFPMYRQSLPAPRDRRWDDG